VRLLVPADDLDRSRLLLEGRGPASASSEATTSTERCVVGGAWSWLALGLVLLGLLMAALLTWQG
jgi:hypothetical protein